MKSKKALIIFFGLVAVGACFYLFTRGGYYPALIINSHFIKASAVGQYYDSALSYLRTAAVTYGADTQSLESESSYKEIKRAILSKLAEDYLIHEELERQLGSDLESIVNKQIGQMGDRDQLEKAAKDLYHLSLEDFVARVLRPQAYREVLTSRLFLVDKDFDKWLVEAKKQASVVLLMRGFEWSDGEVRIVN